MNGTNQSHLSPTRLNPWRGVSITLLLLAGSTVHAESLLELWGHVVESNPTLKSSEHAVEQARAQQDQALAKLLPNASIKGFYSFNSLNDSVNKNGFNLLGNSREYTGYNGNITISQAIFDLPSYLRLQGAHHLTRQQEHKALALRMQIAYNLVDNYLLMLEAEDIMEALAAERNSTAAQIQRLRHMHEYQLVKVTDLYEVEAYGQALETSSLEADHQRAIAAEKVREIAGVPVEHPDKLHQETFPDLRRGADEWVDEALRSNPALLTLQYASESAQQMIASANAQHLPTASVSASETIANTIYNNLQTEGLDSYNIGTLYLNVNIPIYSGGAVEAGVRESVQQYQITREKIEETRRAIEKETRTAWYNVVSGHSRIDSSRKEVEFREKVKDGQQKGYELGAATIIDVLDAQRRLLEARAEFQKAKYDFVRSLIRLRLNSGSLADLDLEAINGWFMSN